MKIKSGDTVLIMSGKDKGKSGKVAEVFPKEEKIMVENINLVKKHVKPKKSGEKVRSSKFPDQSMLPV